MTAYEADYFKVPLEMDKFEEYSPKQLKETIHQLEADMRHAAKEMKFEQAAEITGQAEVFAGEGVGVCLGEMPLGSRGWL